MTSRQSSAKRPTVSASAILEALGVDLLQIKQEDRLTFADIGRVLGKSEDQAAKYCEGTAEMGATALYFGKLQWNGRFTGRADALIEAAKAPSDDRHKESRVLQAALALSIALADGEVETHEIHQNRATLEHAREAIDELLKRAAPRAVQG
jgi:hypothetical protein